MKLLNRNRYIFWSLLLLLHLLVLGWQVVHSHWFLVDSYEYVYASESIKEDGSWYSKDPSEAYDPGHHSRRPPLYPFLLMLGSFLTDSPVLVALWQIALSLFNIFLLVKMIKQLSSLDENRTYLFTLPFLLLLPAQYIYANLLMTEILFQALLTGGIWLAIRAFEEKKSKWYWAISICLVLAMATKPVMYLFFLPFLVLMAYQAWKLRMAVLLLVGLLPLFFVLAYQGINQQRTGYFHYSSVQSLNLLQLTAYNLLINQLGEEEAVRITDDIHNRALEADSFAEGQKLMQKECLEIMWEYRGFYFFYHLKGMANFFLDPGRFDLYHLLGMQEVGAGAGLSRAFSEGGYRGILRYLSQQPLWIIGFLLMVFVGNGLRFLGFVAFLFIKKIPLAVRFSVFVLVGYLSALTGPYGASRFSLPVNLLLILAAVLSIHHYFFPKSSFQ